MTDEQLQRILKMLEAIRLAMIATTITPPLERMECTGGSDRIAKEALEAKRNLKEEK